MVHEVETLMATYAPTSSGSRSAGPARGHEFTLESVIDVLSQSGMLAESSRKTALAQQRTQRARLLKEQSNTASAQTLKRAQLSPIELLASFHFTHAAKNEVLDEDRITQALAQALGLPYRKIDTLKLDAQSISRVLSGPFARKNGVLPLERTNGSLYVAATDPFNVELFEELRRLVGADIVPVLCSPTDIYRAIIEIYGFHQQIKRAAANQPRVGAEIKNLEQFVNLGGLDALEASSAPIVAAVEYLLHYAFEQRASDIHIEPRRDETIFRVRIDGVLHPVYRVPKAVHGAIANRFKIMSRLDVASRKPQDGRIRTSRGDSEMDLRISSVPTAFGDKIVVRVLNPKMLLKDLSELGFLSDERKQVEEWLMRPHGLVIVTGPTGSGKTTTLYSMLQALVSPEVNIVTIEDPIEMTYEHFNQISADPKTGTGFADALRHILRQDPDVVMVGEIRDSETAIQAIQAALTGHLVLSTLHTRDSVGAIARMRDLGVPSFMIAATLNGVIAQRLVRLICPGCGADIALTADQIAALGVTHPEDYSGDLLARHGLGCVKCRNTGYHGRSGVFEILAVNKRLRQAISDGATPEVLWRTARQDGLRILREHAIHKIAGGATSFDEAMQATLDVESR
jgi:general secretion pathway protein E